MDLKKMKDLLTKKSEVIEIQGKKEMILNPKGVRHLIKVYGEKATLLEVLNDLRKGMKQ